jgi:hypothetical protein
MYCNSTLFPGDEEYIGLYTVFPGRETAYIGLCIAATRNVVQEQCGQIHT